MISFTITTSFILFIIILNNARMTIATFHHSELSQVHCFKEFIQVEVSLLTKTDGQTKTLTSRQQHHHHQNSHMLPQSIHWQNIRNGNDDPLKRCQPLFYPKGFMFKIPLSDLYKCGFTRVVNKLSGQVTFYQNLLVETIDEQHTLPVKCLYKRRKPTGETIHKIRRRDILPEDFKEYEDLDIIETLEQKAPEPIVTMEVRQNGQLIDQMVTVIPGTPLIMEIKLNEPASGIYGIHTKYLEVSDGNGTSETILFRGCTVDPYLFENFIMNSNNTLHAKFRAFKFPNTAYVQFRANVQICLGKCQIPHCLSGQGRLKRDLRIAEENIYDIALGLTINVDGWDKKNIDEIRMVEEHVKNLHSQIKLKEHVK
ncbi:uncharacterized protein LOC142238601 [Haematobia irritans]|uniref:uncharacterized protein LOC142238601 n=1 Tax=Haematobia irritans TaxID=7368 RepID=UPI003F502C24